jgi:hypothetical protein
MPLIKPRTVRTKLVRHITQLFAENQEELYAYASFIGESTAYVLNELVETLKKDPDYRTWRAGHTESFIPKPGQVKPRRSPSTVARTSAGRAGLAALPPSA